jgi:dipeptidyl aminopeptidase/acylaminoacyl peptidase
MLSRSLIIILTAVIAISSQEAPVGTSVQPSPKEKKALDSFKNKLQGKVVWSSSRANSKHDIWLMNADGTGITQLTKSNNVDWYPRISPDGSKVLFVRSKSGWVPESDAEQHDKWDLWIINIDGTNEKKAAEDACWGTWRPSGDSIVFARGPLVVVKSLVDDGEKNIFDSEQSIKKGTYSQQPQLSPSGKKIAITIRGSKRETGIWNLDQKIWYSTGKGCQIDWYPDETRVIRMNEGQGNGGTEVLSIRVDQNGRPIDKISDLRLSKEIRLMDLPGRRSHEYFPKLDNSGKWLVWCATQYGHEHDLYDYELFIWNISQNKEKDWVRLTFHTGNDRWPDIFTGNSAK